MRFVIKGPPLVMGTAMRIAKDSGYPPTEINENRGLFTVEVPGRCGAVNQFLWDVLQCGANVRQDIRHDIDIKG